MNETSNLVGSPVLSKREAGQKNESEFDRFESLTRKLVQVPKSAVDKKRKKKA